MSIFEMMKGNEKNPQELYADYLDEIKAKLHTEKELYSRLKPLSDSTHTIPVTLNTQIIDEIKEINKNKNIGQLENYKLVVTIAEQVAMQFDSAEKQIHVSNKKAKEAYCDLKKLFSTIAINALELISDYEEKEQKNIHTALLDLRKARDIADKFGTLQNIVDKRIIFNLKRLERS
ncbi:MAG: hypothetical protein M1331_03815 [Candidatus Marsarchaeota archaeon]|nr:hypothetical protein [Candidatus Marsarchaeota archaeon]MCL5106494.1 hypothetical protein [Candidatus Marsarchaeota archaeon]